MAGQWDIPFTAAASLTSTLPPTPPLIPSCFSLRSRVQEDAQEFVKKQAFFMKRALDQGVVRDALKMASQMTGELRTSRLSPKNYYELYMNITDELRELELFLEEEDGQGRGRARAWWSCTSRCSMRATSSPVCTC